VQSTRSASTLPHPPIPPPPEHTPNTHQHTPHPNNLHPHTTHTNPPLLLLPPPQFWGKRPGELTGRWANFAAISTPWLTKLANAFISGKLEARQGALAKDAVENLERLGPTFIKLGARLHSWQRCAWQQPCPAPGQQPCRAPGSSRAVPCLTRPRPAARHSTSPGRRRLRPHLPPHSQPPPHPLQTLPLPLPPAQARS
jgi:hypothetical protein